MAKKKTNTAKKAVSPARSSSGKSKSTASTKKAAKTTDKSPIKRVIIKRYPIYEIRDAQKEKKQIKNQLRSVDRRFEKETRKTYLDKIRREKRSLEKAVDQRDLKIKEAKDFIKFRDEKNRVKGNIKAKINRREDKLEKLYQDKNFDEYKKLNNEVIKLQLKINDIERQLGRKPKEEVGIPPMPEKLVIEENKGKISRTLTVWDGARRLKEALRTGEFKSFVINGEKFDSGNASIINAVATDIWKNANAPGGNYNVQIQTDLEKGIFYIDNL
jgi:hypothetical protein